MTSFPLRQGRPWPGHFQRILRRGQGPAAVDEEISAWSVLSPGKVARFAPPLIIILASMLNALRGLYSTRKRKGRVDGKSAKK